MVLLFSDMIDRDDMVGTNRRRDPPLMKESLAIRRIGQPLGIEHLDGRLAAQPVMNGLVDDPHAGLGPET